MRILFLCSSLEPGRDGVGDYVRQLARACASQGHACALLALNDPHVAAPTETLDEDGTTLLRMPSLGDGTSCATGFRERFAPDWISLQLVAYGLHPRGLLFAAPPALRTIIGRTRLHLMLHELWLGNDDLPSWRHRLIGFFQRTSLQRLIGTLRPSLVTTTNPIYAALLRTIGVTAEILPLCGNIPIEIEPPALPEAIASFQRSGPTWLGLFFGGLYREWRPEPFFGHLARAAKSAGRTVGLIQAGNPGADGKHLWATLEHDYGATFCFFRLGSQPAPEISALMQAADFGIAASPWTLIGKSGSAAAMLDHGLPVIVTRDDFRPRVQAAQPPTTDPLAHRCDGALEAALIAGLPRRAPRSTVPDIAARLVGDMTAATSLRS